MTTFPNCVFCGDEAQTMYDNRYVCTECYNELAHGVVAPLPQVYVLADEQAEEGEGI